MFDALTGNTDRHPENWAVYWASSRSLAPSYDHGTSLGFNVPPRRRADVGAVARRGVARHFPGKPALTDLARQALDRAGSRVTDLWLSRIARLDPAAVGTMLRGIPDGWMPEAARTFVVDFVATSQRGLTR